MSEAEESGSDIERAKPKTKAKQPARTGARTTPANCVTAAHLYPVAALPTCVLAWEAMSLNIPFTAVAKRRPERTTTSDRNMKKPKVEKSPSKRATGKDEKKWDTLEHGGVLFPPEYVPHGVKLKYDGVPVDLTPEQEEVATMYASMLETEYVKEKATFVKNFWDDFKGCLGKNHKIRSLEKCDFRDIYDHLMKEREAKKALSKEVRVRCTPVPGPAPCWTHMAVLPA